MIKFWQFSDFAKNTANFSDKSLLGPIGGFEPSPKHSKQVGSTSHRLRWMLKTENLAHIKLLNKRMCISSKNCKNSRDYLANDIIYKPASIYPLITKEYLLSKDRTAKCSLGEARRQAQRGRSVE
jgi:hypothetical protein